MRRGVDGRFGDERYGVLFREMQVTKYVYDATSALQSRIGKVEVDPDCAEYLDEILSNAVPVHRLDPEWNEVVVSLYCLFVHNHVEEWDS